MAFVNTYAVISTYFDNVIDFHDSYHDETLRRNDSEFDALLTKIEANSQTLHDLLDELYESAPEAFEKFSHLRCNYKTTNSKYKNNISLLTQNGSAVYTARLNSSAYLNELMLEQKRLLDVDRELNEKKGKLLDEMYELADEIAKVDAELFNKIQELYYEITMDLDDKYNEFDKYYCDDFF